MKNKKYWVYIHTFPNGKKYVGLTTQKNVKRRWLGGDGYKGQLVYKPILKYGWKNIEHKIYECETEAEMKYLERYLIAYYNTTDRRYGYNITDGGESANGVIRANRKPIDQYDKFGNFIKTWDSTYSVGKEMNWDSASITACLKKRQPTAYNYYWCYTGETPEFKKYRTKRKVCQYDLNCNFIREFENAAEAGRSLGKDNCAIVECCNGKRKSAYKFIWKYEC